uniref:Msh n=1 Tax=Agrobacterium tumefaciens TaxID=358 RepID=Q44371_AGRTU|nr:msh [Agrobacterium tumefaciens]
MSSKVTILDGGMGRELLRNGAPFRQPEWSALSLIEAPEFVKMAHDAFVAAGAEVITTNSYALVPFHIGDQALPHMGLLSPIYPRARSCRRAEGTTVCTGCRLSAPRLRLLPARFVRCRQGACHSRYPRQSPKLLTSISGSPRPRAPSRRSKQIRNDIGLRLRGPAVGFLYARRTTKSVADVICLVSVPTLVSGEAVAQRRSQSSAACAGALLFNCSQAEIMEAGVKSANQALKADNLDIPIGLRQRLVPKPETEESLAANDGLSGLRDDLNPSGYLQFAQRWVSAGATIIGGCCGIGPEHIAELKDTFDPQPAAA